ncbi:MAG TPA: rubrerythrin [Nitrospiraceae bacterium]|nr:rubrerythrin [Nitrospiraceae bacterium]
MDIRLVIEMEGDAERHYRTLADKATNPGLKSVMLLLAEEEARHYEYYKSLAKGDDTGPDSSRLISAVTEVFLAMRQREDTSGIEISQVALYKKALEAEREHYEFYRRKAAEAEKDADRQMFLMISEEEQRHARVLESVIEFVSRPEEWLENAEWYHLEEY